MAGTALALLLCAALLPAQAQGPAAPTAEDPGQAITGIAPPSAAAAIDPSQAVAAVEPPKPTTIDAASGADAVAPADKPDPDDTNGIAATVNDESISDYDLRQRMGLYIATAGLHPTDEDMKRIRAQTLDSLENEKMQLQEAVKKHITVSPTEVDRHINTLLTDNHITIEQMRATLANAGTSELAMRSQITAQIAWQKTVESEYANKVNVTPEQIQAELRRYAEGADKPHFLVSEIFLAVDAPEQDAKVLKEAQEIGTQLQGGAPFAAIAHQMSQNPAAAQGGQIGWVHEGQLAPELNSALVTMTPGKVSAPIRSAGGYYILLLQARQEPVGTKVAAAPTAANFNPDTPLPLVRLLLPMNASSTKEMAESAMKAAIQIRGTYTGCAMLKTVATKLPGSVFMDLGMMKPADLSPNIQKALSETQSGEATLPLVSDAGIELIGRCDPKVVVQTAYVMPTQDQVEEQLFDEQISAMARRYMRDLKRDADVEVR